MTRIHWIATGLAILAGTALAEVKTVRAPHGTRGRDIVLDVGIVPPECRQFRTIPADSRSELVPWAQKLSLAACRQTVVIAPVTDPEGLRPMVAALEHAAEPSIELYRDAMGRGPSPVRMLGAYGLGMTYLNIAVRARGAIRVPTTAYGGATYGAAYFEHLQQMQRTLDPLLANDLAQALAAFDEAGFLAEDYPLAARSNDVVKNAVASAHAEADLLRYGWKRPDSTSTATGGTSSIR